VRQVKLEGDAIHADVEGVTEDRGGIPVLTGVRIHYRLTPGARDTVERALARHQDRCPTANTLKGAVRVSWSADIEEA
jgi:uncharacterized OsmC-like protein